MGKLSKVINGKEVVLYHNDEVKFTDSKAYEKLATYIADLTEIKYEDIAYAAKHIIPFIKNETEGLYFPVSEIKTLENGREALYITGSVLDKAIKHYKDGFVFVHIIMPLDEKEVRIKVNIVSDDGPVETAVFAGHKNYDIATIVESLQCFPKKKDAVGDSIKSYRDVCLKTIYGIALEQSEKSHDGN